MEAEAATETATEAEAPEHDSYQAALDILEGAEEKPVEETAEAEEKPEEKIDKLAPKFAALAKREKEVRAQSQELKSQLTAFQAREAEINKLENLRQNAQNDPHKYLEAAGLTFQDITEFVLNDNKIPVNSEIQALKAQIEEMKQGKAQEIEAARQYQAQQQEQNIIQQFKNDTIALADAEKENFAYVSAFGQDAIDAVWDVTETYFNEHGKLLNHKEALQLVEDYYQQEADKILSIKNAIPQAPIAEPKQKTMPQRNESATLQNVQQSTIQHSDEPLTDAERMKRALEALEYH